MKQFSIDLYLWYEEAYTWLFVPPYNNNCLEWTFMLSQSEILECDIGFDFRVDKNLILGNERDRLSLEMGVSELGNTLLEREDDFVQVINVSEVLKIKLQKQDDEMLISRICTRESEDYFDKVANIVGSYYEDFSVKRQFWNKAVKDSIDGLAFVFGKSKADINAESLPFANWLLARSQSLSAIAIL